MAVIAAINRLTRGHRMIETLQGTSRYDDIVDNVHDVDDDDGDDDEEGEEGGRKPSRSFTPSRPSGGSPLSRPAMLSRALHISRTAPRDVDGKLSISEEACSFSSFPPRFHRFPLIENSKLDDDDDDDDEESDDDETPMLLGELTETNEVQDAKDRIVRAGFAALGAALEATRAARAAAEAAVAATAVAATAEAATAEALLAFAVAECAEHEDEISVCGLRTSVRHKEASPSPWEDALILDDDGDDDDVDDDNILPQAEHFAVDYLFGTVSLLPPADVVAGTALLRAARRGRVAAVSVGGTDVPDDVAVPPSLSERHRSVLSERLRRIREDKNKRGSITRRSSTIRRETVPIEKTGLKREHSLETTARRPTIYPRDAPAL